MEIITSAGAAERLKIDRRYLIVIIGRHPELRPARKMYGVRGAYIWTDEEIQAVQQYLQGNAQEDQNNVQD